MSRWTNYCDTHGTDDDSRHPGRANMLGTPARRGKFSLPPIGTPRLPVVGGSDVAAAAAGWPKVVAALCRETCFPCRTGHSGGAC